MKYAISNSGIAFIKSEEGLRLKAYQDTAGVWTIGYGHTGADVTPDLVITEAQAEQFLRADVGKCLAAIDRLVIKPLNQNQVDALCSFIFNVGVGNDKRGFTSSTLRRIINVDPASEQIPELFGRWNKITVDNKKKIEPVLTRRRQRESDLYFS